MKKLKLLLLGGLFTLFGVFNFSSAWYDDVTIAGGEDITSYAGKDLICPSPTYLKVTCSEQPNCKGGTTQESVTISDGSIEFGNNLCSDWSVSAGKSYFCKAINRYDVSCSVSTDKMPVATLTPVITGLENSINEFIPYVVYVGLGVLGVIIGFVAIKWLINRVRRQSFSVFSSRKRK